MSLGIFLFVLYWYFCFITLVKLFSKKDYWHHPLPWMVNYSNAKLAIPLTLMEQGPPLSQKLVFRKWWESRNGVSVGHHEAQN